MLVNIEPVIYEAVNALDALKAGFVLVNIEPVIYEEVIANEAVTVLEELTANEALNAWFVLVKIEPVTYEAVPANCEADEPVQALGTKSPLLPPPPIALEAV